MRVAAVDLLSRVINNRMEPATRKMVSNREPMERERFLRCFHMLRSFFLDVRAASNPLAATSEATESNGNIDVPEFLTVVTILNRKLNRCIASLIRMMNGLNHQYPEKKGETSTR